MKFETIILLMLTIIILGTHVLNAQECDHTDLSRKFNYKVTAVKTKDKNGSLDTTKIYVQIFNKSNKKQVQKIIINPGDLYDDAYSKCSFVKSYITGKNQNVEVDDNDDGDLIIADFNFDGREDFAIKRENSNSGAFYEYFTQNRSGKFVKDLFLTNKVGYSPEINARNKTLTTYVHADVAGYYETVFKYNPATKKWRLFKSTYKKAG